MKATKQKLPVPAVEATEHVCITLLDPFTKQPLIALDGKPCEIWLKPIDVGKKH